ncbi:MAG: hypothetical protein BJ554DRAFT_6583 [Olpidium bornovanus]|uniref:Uncharacterized protein n=1 Tax=Olpidium bornovanus TaxID=278681 RepID=A0A8H8A211_9FUNG|nr:MAG: hypothetical protein BJ554DRAFT_6583 [Olpidium bornovanus]
MIFFLEPWVARHVMTWVCLLLVTMLFPLIAAWLKIRRHERHRVRRSLTVAQKLFSAPDSNRAWIRPSLIAPATTAAPNPPPEDPPATGGADDSIVGSGFEAEPPPLPPPPHSAGSREVDLDVLGVVVIVGVDPQALDPYSLSLTLSDNSRQPSNSYVPTSYTRFLWFLTAITIALASVLLSQLYAHIFLSTLPHSAPANLVYIYSLTLTSTLMSTLCGAVTRDKIRSPPLELTFRFYFYTTYFVFYRTLFARLRSVDQFAYVQFASSLGVVVMYPAMMSRRCWALFGYFGCAGGAGGGYKRYKRDIGRGFWLRNVAENATMMIFLSIATLLHFSPERNLRFYPYFQFNDPGDPYNYPMTLYCTLVIWASELLSSYAARLVFKRAFGLSITRQASREVKAFPETAVVLGLVTVFVCMGMVLAFCRVDFG